MDAENRPMFDIGSARLQPYFEDILLAMADTIKAVPEDVEEASTGHKKRLHVAKFDIDMVKCCYCNLCTYPCPTECIYMTPSFEDSAGDRYGLIYHFAKMTPEQAAALEEKARKFDEAEAAGKRPAAAAASA